jgi:hypothetical protein
VNSLAAREAGRREATQRGPIIDRDVLERVAGIMRLHATRIGPAEPAPVFAEHRGSPRDVLAARVEVAPDDAS